MSLAQQTTLPTTGMAPVLLKFWLASGGWLLRRGAAAAAEGTGGEGGSLLTLPQAFALFQEYNEETNHWVKGTGEEGVSPRDHLDRAFSMAKMFAPWLDAQEEQPDGLSREVFAWNVLGYARDEPSMRIGLPLLETTAGLHPECGVDEGNRQWCQWLYHEMCWRYQHLGDRQAAERCVSEYNDPRPAARHFASPMLANLQLPGVRARPWWKGAVEREPSLAVLAEIAGRWREMAGEVRGAMETQDFAQLEKRLDFRFADNPEWDPHTAWTGMQLYAGEVKAKTETQVVGWQEEECRLVPVTCALLKSFEDRLLPLFPSSSRYFELIGRKRRSLGYSNEFPTLGITLYKVYPKAGIKPHAGQAGRLVHSLALAAPSQPASTLTVGEDTREWVEGEMLSFDDSFVHSVDNPHHSEPRIVMAINALHPDLAQKKDKSKKKGKNKKKRDKLAEPSKPAKRDEL